MLMKVRALGHAGLEIEHEASRILIDPWFSPDGAFQSSWFPFPDNSHLLNPALFSPDAIVISHEHQDHLDPWFLARVPKNVPVIVPRYPSRVVRRKLEAAGRDVIIELEPWVARTLACGAEIFFVSEQSPMNHDSAIVIRWDDTTLVNLNDARLGPDQLRSIRDVLGGRIDVLTFQGAGASWYPIVYAYSEVRRRYLSRRKRLARLQYAGRTIQIIEPSVAVPFAGPPCFLDRDLASFNDEMAEGIFPDQTQVRSHLTSRGFSNIEVLLPGDELDAHTREKVADPMWRDFSLSERAEYLSQYAAQRREILAEVASRYPVPTTDLFDQFRSHFERLLTLSPYFNERIGMRVGFRINGSGGGHWAVDFRPDSVGVYQEAGTCQYRLEFESRWLPPILEGRIAWEDFFLSLRFRAWREPDIYNDHLLGLLKFADPAALAAVERFESLRSDSESIRIEADGSVYEVQRYCPHAGNDLSDMGEVLPGRILRCLGHHYEFDLETGRCLNGTISPLCVQPVGNLERTGPSP